MIGGMLVSTALNLFVIPVFYVLFVRDKKDREETPVAPSFEEGDHSISDVFEDEPSQPDEYSEKGGVVNLLDEEKREDSSPEKALETPERNDVRAKDDETGNAASDDESKNKD